MKTLEYLIKLSDKMSAPLAKIEQKISTVLPSVDRLQNKTSTTSFRISKSYDSILNSLAKLQNKTTSSSRSIVNSYEMVLPSLNNLETGTTSTFSKLGVKIRATFPFLARFENQVKRVTRSATAGFMLMNQTGKFDRLKNGFEKITQKVSASLAPLTRFVNKLKGVKKESNETTSGIDRLSSKIEKLSMLFRAVVYSAAISFLYNVGSAATDSALKIQNAERVIRFASAEEGANNLAFLENTIDRFNLPLQDTITSFAQVSGAFKDTVLAGQPMRDIFEGVSTAAAAMNLSGEQQQGIFLALSQMMSKGKISAEELNGQLGERLPGAMTIAARSMDMTTGEMMKMMQKGELLSEQFLPAFAAELKRTFGEEAVKAASTPTAVFTRFQNHLERIRIHVGQALIPVLVKLAQFADPLLQQAIPAINVVIGIISWLFDLIGVGIKQMMPLFEMLFSMLEGLFDPLVSIGMTAIQIILFLKGVLLSLLETLFQNIEMGNMLGEAFEIVSDIFSGIFGILQSVWTILGPVLNILMKIAGYIITVFASRVVETLKTVRGWVSTIADAFSWLADLVAKFLNMIGVEQAVKINYDVPKPPSLDSNGSGSLFSKFGSNNSKISSFSGVNNGLNDKGGIGESTRPTNENITSGGAKATNINISIGGLINGGFTIQSTNVKEGAEELRSIVIKELMKVVNGANQVAIG